MRREGVGGVKADLSYPAWRFCVCVCICVITSIVLPFITMESQDSNLTEKTTHQNSQVFKQSQTNIHCTRLPRKP